MAREHFNIPKSTQTFLGEYSGKNISETFENIETYALTKKEKKMRIQIYLHYPKSYTRILIKKIELPKTSTCALSVTLPVVNIEKSLKTSISFADAFGNI